MAVSPTFDTGYVRVYAHVSVCLCVCVPLALRLWLELFTPRLLQDTTPLMLASNRYQHSVMRYLLGYGASVYEQDVVCIVVALASFCPCVL